MVMLWLFIVLVVIAVAAIIAVFIIDRRSGLGPSTGAPKRSRLSWSRRGSEQVIELPRRLANSASLFQLPAVRKRIRAQRWLHALLAVLLVSGLVSAAAIAGRPVRVTERSDALANRDIVLCLDVSTSMVRIDSSVLTTFSEILEDFDGERVGIVAWNSAAQTIVPLTDDYELLRDQLSELGDVLDIDPENVTYKQQLAYQEAFGGTVNSSINGLRQPGPGTLPLHHPGHRQPGHRPRQRADLSPARRRQAPGRAQEPPVLHLRCRRGPALPEPARQDS